MSHISASVGLYNWLVWIKAAFKLLLEGSITFKENGVAETDIYLNIHISLHLICLIKFLILARNIAT